MAISFSSLSISTSLQYPKDDRLVCRVNAYVNERNEIKIDLPNEVGVEILRLVAPLIAAEIQSGLEQTASLAAALIPEQALIEAAEIDEND